MSLNKEYYSLGLTMISRENAKKILMRIIFSDFYEHEQLLDCVASIAKQSFATYDMSISLSYFVILYKHGFFPPNILARMLLTTKFENIHKIILRDDSLVKLFPCYVIMYSIRKRDIELFAKMMSHTEITFSEFSHICLDLPPDEIIKFINIANEYQNIHELLIHVIFRIVVKHNRDSIINIIQNTTARSVLTSELLREIMVQPRDKRYVDLVEK